MGCYLRISENGHTPWVCPLLDLRRLFTPKSIRVFLDWEWTWEDKVAFDGSSDRVACIDLLQAISLNVWYTDARVWCLVVGAGPPVW